ncbi:ClpB protein [Olavius sp. associated proteobacterium Delta 1]|nr:ClpB protein [Olavius sp. associated proteobacterium Delta 1]
MKPFDINYRSAEKFFQDYLQLKQGVLFVRTENPIQQKAHLTLNISVPRVDYAFQLNGTVVKFRNQKAAEQVEKPPGMLIQFDEDLTDFFQKLDKRLLVDEKYQFLLALYDTLEDADSIIGDTIEENTSAEDGDAPDGDNPSLTFEWVREAVAQEEIVVEEVEPQVIVEPPTQAKKNLSPQEREKIQPAANFIMDLTKAMLRSGYYSPEHPGALESKQGLYEQFQKCLGDSQEIMLTNLEIRKKSDILITGILDEPVSVRTMVGAGKAELFVPKLRDFFDRKGLMSFAIKKQMTAAHFESYIDIMSDPKADRAENKKMGELLTQALVEHGISEISTVFMDDMIVLEKNLPWRVEMAIMRLTKDLKVLPMFKAKSDEAILGLKIKIIRDIIRPLKYGQYLKELLINCYIIAEHLEDITAEEIEDVIITGIPEPLLLQTAQFVFEELKNLKELKDKDPSSAVLQRRHESVKRIIKTMSRKMMQLEIKGVQSFLEELHDSHVLAFNELPPDVQYMVNTMKLVRDVMSRSQVYIAWVLERQKPGDAIVMLKCMRRVISVILEQEHWNVAFKLTLAVNKVQTETDIYSPKNNLPPNPFYFVFKDVTDMLVSAYLSTKTTSRLEIDQIVRRLGSKGVDILNLILNSSDDPDVRTDALETIVSMGEVARKWSLKVLEYKDQLAGTLKNALAILREVGIAKKDTEIARKFVKHSDPQVQEESLHTLIIFNAAGLEPLIVRALSNSNDKLRWRAISALTNLSQLSKETIVEVFRIITADPPEDEDKVAIHDRKIAQIIQALGTFKNFPAVKPLEDGVLRAAQKTTESGKGFMNRLKMKNSKADQSAVLLAAIVTLGKIGTAKSSEFLVNLTKGKSPMAVEAQKALKLIESRQVKDSAAQATG